MGGESLFEKMRPGVFLKTCRQCAKKKPVAEFNKDVSRMDGLNRDCKLCANEHRRRWRRENRESYNAAARRLYHKRKNEEDAT